MGTLKVLERNDVHNLKSTNQSRVHRFGGGLSDFVRLVMNCVVTQTKSLSYRVAVGKLRKMFF